MHSSLDGIEVRHVRLNVRQARHLPPSFRSEYGIAFAELSAGPENSKERVLQ
jgi:hypothetical protein